MKLFPFFRKLQLKLFGRQITYSQLGEDLILLTLLENKTDGFYVDVGANSPVKFNNTYLLYKLGWSGINIEPNTQKIAGFKRMRSRDINVNVGISQTIQKLPFYSFKEDTLSTFSKEAADSNVQMGHTLEKTLEIDTVPLSKVLADNLNGRKIDFLSVDTEGFDMEVLKSNDWDKYRPTYILLETLEYKRDGSGKKLNNTFDEYMRSIQYEKIADTFINTLYKDIKN